MKHDPQAEQITIEEPRRFAVRTPPALARAMRAARTLYVVDAIVAGFVVCAYFALGRTVSPSHFGLDVTVLSTLCVLFGLAAWRLPRAPWGWSSIVASGATLLAGVRFGSTGFDGSGIVWLTLYLLGHLWVLPAMLRGARYVMTRYPEHRYVRRLRGEHETFEPSEIRGRLDARRIEASRRAFRRGAVYVTIGGIAVLGSIALLLRILSPPSIVPAVERYVADWNLVSEHESAGTRDELAQEFQIDPVSWKPDPYRVPEGFEGQGIAMPEPLVPEATQDPTAWLVLLMRNGRHGVGVNVRFPVAGREPEALVVYFRWGPDTDGWIPVRNFAGLLRE